LAQRTGSYTRYVSIGQCRDQFLLKVAGVRRRKIFGSEGKISAVNIMQNEKASDEIEKIHQRLHAGSFW
jgi:hypothetical protein